MKIKLEIRDMIPILITEDGEIVENIEVLSPHPQIEQTAEGPVMRIMAEVKILDQKEIKAKGLHFRKD